MPKVPASEARDNLAELISRAAYGKERIILTRRGKSLAAIVSMEDLRRLKKLDDDTMSLAELESELAVSD